MKGQEAEWDTVPLSLSPPAGARGLWEGRAEVASAKVPPLAGSDFQNWVERGAGLPVHPCAPAAFRLRFCDL